LLTKTLRLKHIIFSLLYEALLFLFIVFFLYLEIINWASVSLQTRDKHEELYEKEHVKHEDSYRSSLYLCDELRQSHVSYISKYSYFNISCCNIIFFSRISQLYEQSYFKAAHCSNESELTLKAASLWLTQIWRKKSEIQTLTTTNCC